MRVPDITANDHHMACETFTHVVQEVGDGWSRPSPCEEWNARAVVEHVIGFHDVLVLRPLDAKPKRPKDDPEERWRLTAESLDRTVMAPYDPSVVDLRRLIPILTTDVLLHTWDLAKAVDVPCTLPEPLVEKSYRNAVSNGEALRKSGMFGEPLELPTDMDRTSRMLGLYGRDPRWAPKPT